MKATPEPSAASAGTSGSTSPNPLQKGPRGPDRRQRPTPRFSRYSFFGGRRRGARREDESASIFVDVYRVRLLLLVVWVVLMNSADSFFTLIHLQHGGTEVNPIAGVLLTTGLAPFVLLKSVLIALALVVLCVHKNFHMARLGLWVSAVAYTVLCAYHLALFGV